MNIRYVFLVLVLLQGRRNSLCTVTVIAKFTVMVAGSQAISSDFEFYVTGKPLRWLHIVKVIFMGSNIHCCLLKWIARSRLSDGKERTR